MRLSKVERARRHGRIALLVIASAFAVTGCDAGRQPASAPVPRAPAPLDLPEGGASVDIVQRRSGELPGSTGAYRVRIDDITGGQVKLWITGEDGAEILAPRSVRQGERVPFEIATYRYELEVETLENLPIGDDWGRFVVRALPDPIASAPARSESQRIEALLAAIAASNVTFIRNGAESPPSAAVEHLRRKWTSAGNRVETAEQFIEQLASRSSLSGKPYRVRLADGTERDAAPWFRARLAEVDAK